MKSLLVPVLALSCLVFGAVAPAAAAVPGEVHTAAAKTVSARALLATLKVAAPDRRHRYARDRFGYDEGVDADGDGCFTRKEVLIRDHIGSLRISPSCAVSSTWKSLYDNRVTSTASRLEIDHLVPLAEAWHAGAWQWSHARQIAFGNDLGYRWELQPVTASLNQDKGDKDPAKWLPPANRCTYAKAWIGVKHRWSLTVDAAEKSALTRALARCSSVQVLRPGKPDIAALSGTGSPRTAVVTPAPVPTQSAVVTAPPVVATPIPTPTPTVVAVPVSTPTQSSSPTAVPVPAASPSAMPAPVTSSSPLVFYANCTAVRDAGKAPLYRDQPGYSAKLDRDGDGVACE